MHIVVVTRNLRAGGVERVIVQLLKEWSSHGNQCSVVCMHPNERFFQIPEEVECVDVPNYEVRSGVAKIKKYKYLRKMLMEQKPDVVLAMPEEIGIYVILAMLGTGIPVVVSERNNPWTMPYKKISRIIRRIAYPFVDGLIFQTKQAASFFPVSQQKKGIVLPNPLDLSRIPDPWDGEREKVIAGAGRFDRQKNFFLLIDAFFEFNKTHPDYKLVIYGDGVLRSDLEAYAARKLPAGTYSLPGQVQDLPEQLKKVTAFVLSSDYEGMPNVLIEALAMGVPCVSTDCPAGGPKELIRNGENGYLVPVKETAAMAAAMEKVIEGLAGDPYQLRVDLDAQKVAQQWEQFLASVVK